MYATKMNLLNKSTFNYLTVILFYLCLQTNAFSQNYSSDELFTMAREAAFEEDNYPKAIKFSKKALDQSPNYTGIRVFLGRLYTWSKNIDSARVEFEKVLKNNPGHEDGSFAYASLEYWNDDSKKALNIINNGLEAHPDSENLLLLKAKVLKDLKEYKLAQEANSRLLKINPGNTEARSLSQRLTTLSAKNQIGLTYDFVYFDEQFDDPWHLSSIDYSRQTKLGSVVARVNYANRFRTNAFQFEVDAYPSISKTFYAYVNAGISDKEGIFPDYRAGFSLYANLPWAMEAEAGFRLLGFDDETWIYTASVGKYYKSFWFNFRTFLTPSNSSVSQSFSLITRYYLGGADDYLNLRIGTGLSPDNQTNNILYNNGNQYRLKSNNIFLGYRKTLWSTNVVFIEGGLENQEYRQGETGNQFTIGVGYLKRF
ncbi:YaiO family outer membrane beta-barrel protein [Zunongwangia sp. HRR-M8]|uniref:YaiO family outer membrane beta-barrel protein n=1 Tax=Zunongwangia sp. HRR-M8 TaxID=3015170 RepID=UPI0022DD665A|nr:YaiO family outer membrane beta-barrel protein [Zunongwangia sp. HRR-M8]WBL21361.1 YaiO family outer membrane beta-barrel protein [Zunongwangia sp. HRR-M8]